MASSPTSSVLGTSATAAIPFSNSSPRSSARFPERKLVRSLPGIQYSFRPAVRLMVVTQRILMSEHNGQQAKDAPEELVDEYSRQQKTAPENPGPVAIRSLRSRNRTHQPSRRL